MEAWKEELYHHGIKGQKWGVRRYQNSDGTLTNAGKRHLARDLKKHLNDNEQEYARLSGYKNNAVLQANRAKKAINRLGDKAASQIAKSKKRGEDESVSADILKKAHDKAVPLANKYKSAVTKANEIQDRINNIESDTWKTVAKAAESNMRVTAKEVELNTTRGKRAITGLVMAGGVMALPAYMAVASIDNARGVPHSVPANKWKVKPDLKPSLNLRGQEVPLGLVESPKKKKED